MSLSLEMLSLFAVIYNVVKLALQLDFVKKITLSQSYILVMISDVILVASTIIYFIDSEFFIYTNYCAVIIQGLILKIFSINYYSFISDRYGVNIFKSIQYSESFIYNIVAIVGSSIAFIQAEFFCIHAAIKLYLVFLIISIWFQMDNFFEFKELINACDVRWQDERHEKH
ncbi:MAG: hypothetical protein OEV64_02530 [Desulfobulbaceae bacterium]|nr:hypothetical protein [Desulfobulbaceae bacterium]